MSMPNFEEQTLVRKGVVAWLLPLLFVLFNACQNDNNSPKTTKGTAPVVQKINDYKLKNLQGQVKLVIEKSYTSPSEVLADDPFSITQTSFRTDGNIKEMLIEMKNSERNTFTYAYLEDSILVRSIRTLGDSILDKQFYLYLRAADGIRYKMFSYDQDQKLLLSSTILNNDSGFPIENQNSVSDSSFLSRIPCKEKFGYDENGYLTEETWFRYNPQTKHCEPTNTLRRYTNDERGNCIKELIVKDNDMLLGHYSYLYKYDAKGNWTEKTSYAHIKGEKTVKSVMLREFEYFE